MNWNRLINDKRFGLEELHQPKTGLRSDFQRDYDRLIFSSPFRRLQNKTQVFPLPGSIFVHNRLTHSLEVSSCGRSIANEVVSLISKKYENEPETLEALSHLDEIVAAACLAHDLGNPPFGHSGEKAISTFFSEGEGSFLKDKLTSDQWKDLTNFEGNANAFRLLTHSFKGRRKGGFAMTYSTLASVVKYPFNSIVATKNKFGFFSSELESFRTIANELGLIEKENENGRFSYARHPLVYIVEAADDICYEIMDLEDAHKLKILGTDEVKNLLLNFFETERQEKMKRAMGYIDDCNEQIGYLRSCVIGSLVLRVAEAFAENEDKILAGEFSGCLIDSIRGREKAAYKECEKTSWSKIYCAGDVVDIELAGNRIITFLMEKLIHAVCNPELTYSKLLLARVPRQYEVDAETLFEKIQAVIDHVSAMTDVYALDLYRKLNGLSLPAV